jgi:hypothetical protein
VEVLECRARVVPRGQGAALFEDRREVALYPVGRCEITELTAVGDDGCNGTTTLRTTALTGSVYVALRDFSVLGTIVPEDSPIGGEAVIRGTVWSRNRGLVVDARAVARGTEDERTEFRWLVPAVRAGAIERGQPLGEWLGISPLRPVGSK